MSKPITVSCINSDLEKQIVRRANRLIRVRKSKCFRSMLCVWSLPTWWMDAGSSSWYARSGGPSPVVGKPTTDFKARLGQ